MADPDLQIIEVGGRGRRAVIQTRDKGGGGARSIKIFFLLFGPHFGLKIKAGVPGFFTGLIKVII